MMKGYLALYKEISYHLQEFRRRGRSPRTRHKKFNHAHSSLWYVIERNFSVWKNKWTIIRNMLSFPFYIQILIVSATMAFHNFVRLNDGDDRGFIHINWDSISRREHNNEAGSSYKQNSRSLADPQMELSVKELKKQYRFQQTLSSKTFTVLLPNWCQSQNIAFGSHKGAFCCLDSRYVQNAGYLSFYSFLINRDRSKKEEEVSLLLFLFYWVRKPVEVLYIIQSFATTWLWE